MYIFSYMLHLYIYIYIYIYTNVLVQVQGVRMRFPSFSGFINFCWAPENSWILQVSAGIVFLTRKLKRKNACLVRLWPSHSNTTVLRTNKNYCHKWQVQRVKQSKCFNTVHFTFYMHMMWFFSITQTKIETNGWILLIMKYRSLIVFETPAFDDTVEHTSKCSFWPNTVCTHIIYDIL